MARTPSFLDDSSSSEGSGDALQVAGCSSEFGDEFLARLRAHQVELCGAAEPRQHSSSLHDLPFTRIFLNSIPYRENCEKDAAAHLAVLYNASLSDSGITVETPGDCGNGVLSEVAGMLHGMPIKAARPNAGGLTCDHWVEEDTIFVQSPRREYFQNYYHSMEEVFSVFETARVLGKGLSDFRYIFAWGASGGSFSREHFLVLPEQADDPSISQEAPPEVLKQMLELWSALTRRESDGAGVRPIFASLAKSGGSVCFRRMVLPMRACEGSILPATWLPGLPSCEHGSSIMRNVRNAILRAYRSELRSEASSSGGGGQKWITLVVRSGPKRQLANQEEVKKALSALPGFQVREVDFAKLSFAEQQRVVRHTQVLIGVHGAGLAHAILLPEGAGLVEITSFHEPVGRSVANIFHNMALLSGHPYRAVQTQSLTGSILVESLFVDPAAVAGAVQALAGHHAL